MTSASLAASVASPWISSLPCVSASPTDSVRALTAIRSSTVRVTVTSGVAVVPFSTFSCFRSITVNHKPDTCTTYISLIQKLTLYTHTYSHTHIQSHKHMHALFLDIYLTVLLDTGCGFDVELEHSQHLPGSVRVDGSHASLHLLNDSF